MTSSESSEAPSPRSENDTSARIMSDASLLASLRASSAFMNDASLVHCDNGNGNGNHHNHDGSDGQNDENEAAREEREEAEEGTDDSDHTDNSLTVEDTDDDADDDRSGASACVSASDASLGSDGGNEGGGISAAPWQDALEQIPQGLVATPLATLPEELQGGSQGSHDSDGSDSDVSDSDEGASKVPPNPITSHKSTAPASPIASTLGASWFRVEKAMVELASSTSPQPSASSVSSIGSVSSGSSASSGSDEDRASGDDAALGGTNVTKPPASTSANPPNEGLSNGMLIFYASACGFLLGFVTHLLVQRRRLVRAEVMLEAKSKELKRLLNLFEKYLARPTLVRLPL